MLFDIGTPALDVLAHERRKELLRVGGGVPGDAQDRALGWVHRRVPQLLGIHLAQALEAFDLDAPPADVVQRGQDRGNVGDIDHVRLG